MYRRDFNRNELRHQLSTLRVIQADFSFEAGDSDLLSVGPEGDGVDRTADPGQLVQQGAAVGVVNAGRSARRRARADDEAASILIELQAEDPAGKSLISADAVEVVADDAGLGAVNLVELRLAVGPPVRTSSRDG